VCVVNFRWGGEGFDVIVENTRRRFGTETLLNTRTSATTAINANSTRATVEIVHNTRIYA